MDMAKKNVKKDEDALETKNCGRLMWQNKLEVR